MSKARTASKAEEISKNYRIFPKKYLGQNFLVDKDVLSDIIKTAELKPKDVVVEIGPGLGVLTRELAKRAGKVIAIEKDERLVKILKERELKDFENIEIIKGDILQLSTFNFPLSAEYKVVANLPYYIVSPVIRKFLTLALSPSKLGRESRGGYPPKLMVLMVQKEVAERICARPPEMSVLAVAVQLHSVPKIVRIVGKESFWPKPKVDSAILRIVPKKSIPLLSSPPNLESELSTETEGVNLFFKIVKTGFSSPRKQLKNNLKKIFGAGTEEVLKKAGIEPIRRAETLTVEEWIEIYDIVK